MEVKMDITFAISSSIVLHAVLNSLFNFPFNSLRKAHNSQQAELAKVFYVCVNSYLSLIIFTRNNYLLYLTYENRNNIFRNIPHNIIVHAHIVMNQAISHTSHLPPRNTLPSIFHISGNLLSSFSNDGKTACDGSLQSLISQEICEFHFISYN